MPNLPTTRDDTSSEPEGESEADGPQDCPQCGCKRGQRASGDNGDGVWFQAWVCQCECHEAEDDPRFSA